MAAHSTDCAWTWTHQTVLPLVLQRSKLVKRKSFLCFMWATERPAQQPNFDAQQSNFIRESCAWISSMLIICTLESANFRFPLRRWAMQFRSGSTVGIKCQANKKIMSTARDTGRGWKLCVLRRHRVQRRNMKTRRVSIYLNIKCIPVRVANSTVWMRR